MDMIFEIKIDLAEIINSIGFFILIVRCDVQKNIRFFSNDLS